MFNAYPRRGFQPNGMITGQGQQHGESPYLDQPVEPEAAPVLGRRDPRETARMAAALRMSQREIPLGQDQSGDFNPAQSALRMTPPGLQPGVRPRPTPQWGQAGPAVGGRRIDYESLPRDIGGGPRDFSDSGRNYTQPVPYTGNNPALDGTGGRIDFESPPRDMPGGDTSRRGWAHPNLGVGFNLDMTQGNTGDATWAGFNEDRASAGDDPNSFKDAFYRWTRGLNWSPEGKSKDEIEAFVLANLDSARAFGLNITDVKGDLIYNETVDGSGWFDAVGNAGGEGPSPWTFQPLGENLGGGNSAGQSMASGPAGPQRAGMQQGQMQNLLRALGLDSGENNIDIHKLLQQLLAETAA